MRPEWDFSPIRMRTMYHLPHIFFDTQRPERPDCPVLVPSSFSRSRDRIINMDIYSYEPCGLPTGNFMPAEKSQIRLMTASPITVRACIPAPDQVTPEQSYFKDLDFYKKTLFHTPFLSLGRAVTLLEYRDAQIVFEVVNYHRGFSATFCHFNLNTRSGIRTTCATSLRTTHIALCANPNKPTCSDTICNTTPVGARYGSALYLDVLLLQSLRRD